VIVDSSVLVCLLREEPDSQMFIQALARAPDGILMSTANHLETAIVIDANGSDALSARFDAIVAYWQIALIPVSTEQGRIARDAYRRFGKGRHPAGLNFGDCFAYALAKETGRPLLFKGDDFSRTDIAPAV
jgi:ribonuclease VapC